LDLQRNKKSPVIAPGFLFVLQYYGLACASSRAQRYSLIAIGSLERFL
tara:strand:+ start:40769 stop:40912 length:144 start_codon:yes stop_codon:yes gene_type:complete